jgi:hypothetical protein
MGCCGKPRRKVGAAALPKNKPTDPVIRPDGSLLYTGIAPQKKGYVHDPGNPHRLIPDVAPCMYRITAPLLDKNGSYSVMNDCIHPGCEHRGCRVTEDICKLCKLT